MYIPPTYRGCQGDYRAKCRDFKVSLISHKMCLFLDHILCLDTLNSGAHQALFSILKGLDLPNIPQPQDSNLTEAQRQLRSGKVEIIQSDSMLEEVSEPRFPAVVQLNSEPINIQVNSQVGLQPQIVTTLPVQAMPFHQQMPSIISQVGASRHRLIKRS